MEIRTVHTNIRATTDTEGKLTVAGRAVPYGVEILLWTDGYYEEREVIEPGAFAESIKNDDQRALWNHNRAIVLGRRTVKTLRLADTKEGVDFEIDFPDSPEGRSKHISVERGDIAEMSFGFDDINLKEEFFKEGDKRIYKRTVQKAKLWEVSPVTWAAYEADTSVQARSKATISERKQLIDSRLEEAFSGPDGAAALQRGAELRERQLHILGG